MPEPIPDNAVQLVNVGRYEQAAAIIARLLKKQPGDAATNNGYAIVLAKLGRNEQAEFYARRAVVAGPRDAISHETLAHILASRERLAEAIPLYRRAVELDPGNLLFYLGLANMLWDHGDLHGALECCRDSLRVAPGHPELTATYVSLLQNVGELSEAERTAREALARIPAHSQLLQVLVLTLNYVPDADPAAVLDLHRRFGASVMAGVPPAHLRSHPQIPAPAGRKLRVGYISPDLRQHSVTYFLEPILERHDREKFEVFCYFTERASDATTDRLKRLAVHWRDLGGRDDEEVAAVIAGDHLDILVELTGLTSRHRLGVMARKPAPVQVSYLGYPNTTGLPRIDYRIVDAITDPPGSDQSAVERLVRLPGCFACYRPALQAPEPEPPPAASGGPITFGSFNNSAKITEPVVRLWAKILDAVPGSRLIIKSGQFKCPWVLKTYQDRFAAAGAATDRVEILGPISEKGGHLGAYRRIDIALDPFPYNGTTTTCEALWMGVPVVTLEGKTHAGRVGASLLTAAGVPELIARHEAEYLRIATTRAADLPRLVQLRSELREKVRVGLCDETRFVRGLEEAYARMLAPPS